MKRRSNRTRYKLLAASTLADRQVRQVIRCFAEARPAKDAIALSGLSHVTVYRLYGYIRRRLLLARLITPMDDLIAFIKEGEKDGPQFPWQQWTQELEKRLGAHRGIRLHNRPAYAAEEAFRMERGFAPVQLYRLILIAVKAAGPLNREPVNFDRAMFHKEVLRIEMAQLRSVLRQMTLPADFKTFIRAGLEKIEVSTDRYLDLIAGADQEQAARPEPGH